MTTVEKATVKTLVETQLVDVEAELAKLEAEIAARAEKLAEPKHEADVTDEYFSNPAPGCI